MHAIGAQALSFAKMEQTLHLYRHCVLGDALQQAFEDMSSMRPSLQRKVFEHFDRACQEMLSQRVKAKAFITVRILSERAWHFRYRSGHFR
jgi:hypothetical protein